MNLTGVIIGVISFVTIGVFHPIVIKGEYYFSAKIWPIFLVAGIVFCAVSVFIDNTIGSATLAVVGFSCLWSIGELKEQEERVRKGWFPENPKRAKQEAAAAEREEEAKARN